MSVGGSNGKDESASGRSEPPVKMAVVPDDGAGPAGRV
jgi:hypothetical protein